MARKRSSEREGGPPARRIAADATGPLADLLDQLRTSDRGLDGTEAARRLASVGPNDPAPPRSSHPAMALAAYFGNPLVLVLLLASAASATLGEIVNAAIIVAMVLLSVVLNFAQTFRSQRAVERLRKGLAPTATVLRDGAWQERPRAEVVPGDVVRLSAGDLVPGDARLIAARDLHVQEAALTGESFPVEKEAEPGPVEPARLNRSEVFFGTSIVSGTATAAVVATGRATAFGEIAASLARRPPETEFERGSRAFGLLIMKTVVFLVLFIVVIAAGFGRNALESLLFAVALAVGLTPEFLPMITTVTLSRGAVHMARRQVVVKNLAAMQSFGSIDVLCSDKTGTLTTGQMVLDRHVDPFGRPSERVFQLGCLNSLHETGVRSPLDEAVLGHDRADVHAYRKLDEIPFDFERRRLSVVVEEGTGPLLIAKGAPEGILGLCTAIEVAGGPRPLDRDAAARSRAVFEALGAEGFRVLAVAYRQAERKEVYRVEDERDLVLAGYLTFVDPPQQTAAAALRVLRRDGVAVKILTGDNEQVARHVCGRVGLDASRLILGEELSRISDAALGRVVEETTVFARVTPAQKNRIILALKHRGHVVGFLGDGINDAPSLHAADVGISVPGAVDVAKDAAEVILLRRDLEVLHSGIIEGRRAFGNVVKYILMETSSNFGNMFSMAGAFLFLPFLPMLPTQILLNNFLYDLAQVTIPTDRVDPAYIHKPRRWDVRLIRNFMIFVGPISSIFDLLTFVALLALFHADQRLFQSGWFVESLATQLLVIFVIRSAGGLARSPPSAPLVVTTLGVVAIGLALPYSSLGSLFGFVPLPPAFLAFLGATVACYLLLVAAMRRLVMRRMFS